MNIEDKLLIPTKKYLFINNGYTISRAFENYGRISHRRRIKNRYKRYPRTSKKFQGKQLRFYQKKADTDIVGKRYTTYYLLNEEVFKPLSCNFVEYIQSYNFIPRVRFNFPLHEKSSLYIEGITHLEKDIDGFHEKLDQLKKYGEEYNENLEIFEREVIYKLLSDYFEQNGFNVTGDYERI